MDDLATQIELKREFAELICQRLSECVEKIGFPAGFITTYPNYQTAGFELIQDPFTGKLNLSGFWSDKYGHKIGRIQFQSDESCYAEYSVGHAHPQKPKFFIDNAIAWGKMDSIKTELALIAFPE
jgi:hypothetical protein